MKFKFPKLKLPFVSRSRYEREIGYFTHFLSRSVEDERRQLREITNYLVNVRVDRDRKSFGRIINVNSYISDYILFSSGMALHQTDRFWWEIARKIVEDIRRYDSYIPPTKP